MAKDFSDVYEAIRAAEKEGRKEDVAKLVAYLETESAKPSEEDTYDPKNLVSSLTGSGVGAGSAVIGPAIIKKGVEAVKKTPAASSVTVSAAPGSALAGIDEATTKGLSNEVTQQTRTAQRAARTEEMSKIMAELKAKGIPVNPNLLAEVGTQVARPESGILLPVEEARKIATTEDAARVATAAANAPKTSMLSNAANFVKGITDYRIPFTNIQTGPILGRGLVGAGSGLQFADMLNRREMGDTTGAVISGIGGLGTAASLIPYLPARVVGGGVGMAAEAVNAYRDAMRRGDAGQVGPEYNGTMDTMGGMYAQGGLAHLAAGGSVMPNFNLDVKPVPSMTGQPGVGYMQTPAGAMMRLQMEKEMELARLRAGLSGMGMAIPGQQGVKMAPGQMDVGANIPLGRGNLDISANRSINPMPGRGHQQGINARYTMPFAEGGAAKKPDANEGAAFIGYPQINKNRKVGSGTGFLDALVGAPASRTNILNPSDYSYMEGYEKGEPYGIAAMALPFAGMAAKPLTKALGPKAYDMLENYMVKTGGILPATAWHGTPHTFNKFSNDFIGTGEGAQAYGRGMYFAENPNVAKEYQKQLAGRTFEEKDLTDYWQPGSIRKSYGGFDKVIDYDPKTQNVTVQAVKKNDKGEWVNDWQYPRPRVHSTFPDEKEFEKVVGRPQPLAGSLYKVDIPDEYIPKMIEWDKPFKDQPQKLQDAFAKVNPVAVTNKDPSNEFTRWLRLPDTADKLQEMGYKGIKYSDQMSRIKGHGNTKNFVVFDPTDVKILERNSEPVGPLSNLD